MIEYLLNKGFWQYYHIDDNRGFMLDKIKIEIRENDEKIYLFDDKIGNFPKFFYFEDFKKKFLGE